MPVRIEARLPSYSTPFIGRDEDIAAIAQRLSDPHCRLLTLVGPGGIGKTRLALEVARSLTFADGIHFVDLQPVSTGEILVTAITNALGILLSGPQDPRDQLLNYLSIHEMLLLLDNFEHLLDCVDLLVDILTFAPGVKLMVTSREALNIQEEWLWRVAGLQVPDHQSGTNIESSSAVQLFAQCAHRTRQEFTLTGQETPITRICQLVEGMPLALELAAGWTKALSCAEIAHEIQRGLDVLTTNLRNAPERHRSMQAVFDHSWHLLTEAERQVFPRLSVFRGGFRREAAEQVAGASLAVLVGLVDKSFLRLSATGRYEIQELTRQYGDEHLDALPGAKHETRNRHCAYYAGFLHQREAVLRGSQQAAALDEIEAELDNIRLSWQWAVEQCMRETIHQAMHSLHVFCHIRPQTVEGQRLFDMAVKRFEHEDSATLAYLMLAGASMAGFNGRAIVVKQVNKAIRLAYIFWTDDVIALPLCSGNLSKEVVSDFLNIFRTHNQAWGINFTLFWLGEISLRNGNFAEAEQFYRESQSGFRQMGDHWALAWPVMGLAGISACTHQYRQGLQLWQEHEDLVAEVGDRGGVIFALSQKALMACRLQDNRAARIYIAQAIKLYLESGSPIVHFSFVCWSLIEVFKSENRAERAVELLSLIGQLAEKAHASEVVVEADLKLNELAQQLPQDMYQEAVERGKRLHLRTIREQLLDELSDDAPSTVSMLSYDTLTERELEVLRYIADGHSNRQIAHDLFLTLNTVKSHAHHLFGKLGVESRTQAVARARELHLL